MNVSMRITVLFFLLSCIFGCAYRHYLGIHGPTIKMTPEVHEGVKDDEQCLDCHHPDRDPTGPPTSHPGFTGCIKCHNDEIGDRE